MVAVLGDAVAEPVVGGQDHPAAAEQDPWPGDLDLVVARRWRSGPPPLPADTDERLVAGAATVKDVAVIGGQHDDAARLGGRVQQPRQRSQRDQVPSHPQLLPSGQVVVDGIDHDPDDPLVGVGDEAADLVGQRHPARRYQVALVEQHRGAGR